MTPFFRAADPNDVPVLHGLVNRAFRGEEAMRGWTHEAELLEGKRIDATALLAMIEGPGSCIEVAQDNGRIVACVHLVHTAVECYLGMLSVEPACQAAGLGKKMLSHCEELAQGWGCARMRMTVIDLRTELIDYYERRGYRLTGEWDEFPTGFGQLKVPRIRLLKLVRDL